MHCDNAGGAKSKYITCCLGIRFIGRAGCLPFGPVKRLGKDRCLGHVPNMLFWKRSLPNALLEKVASKCYFASGRFQKSRLHLRTADQTVFLIKLDLLLEKYKKLKINYEGLMIHNTFVFKVAGKGYLHRSTTRRASECKESRASLVDLSFCQK